MKEFDILILAAGLGKRMNSDIPKPVFPLYNKPMLVYLLESIEKLPNKPRNIYILVNSLHSKIIKDTCEKYINTNCQRTISRSCFSHVLWLVQGADPKGTGHSTKVAIELIHPDNINIPLLILSADVPMISSETMNNLIEEYYASDTNKSIILCVDNDNPHGYGRIVKNINGDFMKIVEQKDASEQEQEITLVNTGIYCISYDFLCNYLDKVNNDNAAKEYYLTDLFKILKDENKEIIIHILESHKGYEVFNVNTVRQLQQLEDVMNIASTFN